MTDDDPRHDELAANLEKVRGDIDGACRAAGRTDSVDLVVVTKFHTFDDLVRLLELGVRDIGENRVQEAAQKHNDLVSNRPDLAEQARWHMVGQIQSKKAGNVASWADVVHSVDRERIADGLSRGRVRALDAQEVTVELDVLLQLSLDGDTSRGGVPEADLMPLAEYVAGLEGLRLAGLMVVPPLDTDPGEGFTRAEGIRRRLLTDYPEAKTFSAGMSADLVDAVAAGSTCVRVGAAILGPRPIP